MINKNNDDYDFQVTFFYSSIACLIWGYSY